MFVHGKSNEVSLQVKEVLVEPIKLQSPKIILVHNHPTGEAEPSQADINFTARVMEACELMGIEFLDHIVIGNMKYTSILTEALEYRGQNKKR